MGDPLVVEAEAQASPPTPPVQPPDPVVPQPDFPPTVPPRPSVEPPTPQTPKEADQQAQLVKTTALHAEGRTLTTTAATAHPPRTRQPGTPAAKPEEP